MARPAVTEKRQEEILQAYERCIAKFGVYGATLAAVAKEAKISRPLVRHHVGNQEDLLEQAVQRFVLRTKLLLDDIKPEDFTDIDAFIDIVFSSDNVDDGSYVIVASALISASFDNSNIRQHMQEWLHLISHWFYQHLIFHYPNEREEKLNIISAGVMGIYFNVDSLVPLGNISVLREQSKQAARLLIHGLSTKNKT